MRQIIDLRDTNKLRYFATAEFNNCFIIRPSSFFFVIMLGKSLSDSSGFSCKSVVSITHEQNIIFSKTKLDSIGMNRPLYVGSYLQVTWFALGQ